MEALEPSVISIDDSDCRPLVTVYGSRLRGDTDGLAAGECVRTVMEDLCQRLQRAASRGGEDGRVGPGVNANILAGAAHSAVTVVASWGAALRFTVRLQQQNRREWFFAASCWRGDALVLKAVLEEAIGA